ncbi:uncharacterized protein LOC123517334 isoform X2 [Portunus trituberculatus]|uniref:uncharacterized protein LOC123517334 isoform X2 n=1 Tax=Portunus trituberculatus TaxID=210409 RepID=UPI001E1CE260|nr:uncharacterized protein LOC123517334 isoform X2 [Portunus trituberculatus]
MLRGGGLCLAGPGDPALKISPRIRALQDRLMDSLPSDGAWECLSPAQREAILSLHRSRLLSADDSCEPGEGGGRKPMRSHAAFARFTRSRSYDDRLESETDDSGVRGSGATSHNSLEEDSSDTGVKRGPGRLNKVLECQGGKGVREGPQERGGRKGDSKGLGNVNKIISKQMGKAAVPSNITLDCRNVQGEKRRRSRVDVDGPFKDLEAIRERDQEDGASQLRSRPGPSRRTGLVDGDVQPHGLKETHLHALREVKEGGSSEEYDSGVNLKHEDSTDEYMKDLQNRGSEMPLDSECDRSPRSDLSPSPTSPIRHSDNLSPRKPLAERDAFGAWDNSVDRGGHKGRSRDVRASKAPVESRKKAAQGTKLNSAFDYRTCLNQDQAGRYSSSWNNIILNRKVPIKQTAPPARESRFTKNAAAGAVGGGNLASKAAAANNRKPEALSWMVMEPSRTPDRPASRKYLRSKSLDRKYLEDDSTDDDSDFETRRRTERVRRQQRANQEWEAGRGRLHQDRGRQRGPVKAKSAWDLSGQENTLQDDFDDFENVGFRTRSDFRSRWENEDRHRKVSDHSQVGRSGPGNRRSCDFELDYARQDLDMICNDKFDFDRKRWYRRSCDLDLDFEMHHGQQRREELLDGEWGRRVQEHYPIPVEAELFSALAKRSDARYTEQQMLQLQSQGRRGRCEEAITGDAFHLEMEGGRRTRQDDFEEEDMGRRTRLEDYYRARTSLDHRGPDKRPRSRTPHLLRENGVLSFENPNYTLAGGADPRLDDALNRNSDDTLDGGLAALDSLYSELDHVCSLNRTASVRNRRHYAQLDVGSMGVDVASGPVTNLDQADHQNNSLLDNESNIMGRKQGLSYNLHKPDLIEHVTSLQQHQQDQPPTKDVDIEDKIKSSFPESPPPEGGGDSGVVTDGGSTSSSTSSQQSRQSPTHIPHMTPAHSEDLYALPLKRGTRQGGDGSEKVDPPTEDSLPAGWEKHEDNDGPYYWHIKSGTITRTPPEPSQTVAPAPLRAERRNREPDQNSGSVGGTVTRSNTSSALSELSDSRPRTAALDNAYKRRSYPARSDVTEGSGGRPIRFAVRSLGWVEIAEEDLTPERSSKAVNRCIVDLSVGRRDVLDVVGCWGDGKDLFMDLDEGSLKLVDPENLTVLNTQPIHTIRVWGVGRDNGRDFAYVARDRVSRKHMCHVFRCDTPARTIANTLRDICKKIMIERSLQQNLNKPLDTSSGGGGGSSRLTRPTNLPTENRRTHRHPQMISTQSFPTPMEEPKKVMRVQYVGLLQVERPSGMEVLNTAIDRVVEANPPPWRNVSVAVAPSTVTITNTDDGKQIAECRVRFLSFLGIGHDVKHCAFIMHTAQDQFIAYVFFCEPSTGALCKTIEAACKLRYQKCLDAHPGVGRGGRGAGTPRTISATLRSVLGTITGRKARSAES